ncbi:MAG: four helix bundle protein [Anaerolineae bacterium]
MGDYRKLGVWDKAHKLTLHIYQVTKGFPKDEVYGLTSQIRRSAMSVPSNLAEGSGRGSDGELIRFAHIAAGSAHELDYQILLSYH